MYEFYSINLKSNNTYFNEHSDYSWANMNVIIMYTCIKYYNFILKSRGCDFTTKYINLKAEIFNLRS